MTYRLPSMFPTPHHTNIGICVTGTGLNVPFSAIVSTALPDLQLLGNGQFFPRWTYEKVEAEDGQLDLSSASADVDEWGYRKVDNITDEIHTLYRASVGEISKDDIFYYVYGLLHNPSYRSEFAADLKKMLPHIPTPESPEDSDKYTQAGRQLADLHMHCDNAASYPLDIQVKDGVDPDDCEVWRVKKMRWAKMTDPNTDKRVDDRTTIVYNNMVTITGIPLAADQYMLGSRSALAWIIDRYQVKTDKTSGIINDPNDWADEHDDPTYIVDLIRRVTTVAVETMKIVGQMSQEKS